MLHLVNHWLIYATLHGLAVLQQVMISPDHIISLLALNCVLLDVDDLALPPYLMRFCTAKQHHEGGCCVLSQFASGSLLHWMHLHAFGGSFLSSNASGRVTGSSL